MVGAVSLNPYVNGYQYSGGYARMRASSQNTQVQAGQSSGAAAGARAVSTGKSNGVSSLIGARSISAGQAYGVTSVSAGRAADPESPVQPVDAISKLQPGRSGSTNYTIPFLRQGMDPAELSVRMRMQYSTGEDKEAVQPDLPGSAQGTEKEAVQMNLPGSSREADLGAVQPDLPGTSAKEAEQLGLPGTATGKAAEAGLPGDTSESETAGVDSEKDAPEVPGLSTDKTEKPAEETECKTCKERKYQDGSNDPGVSFKTPTHIAPEQSSAAVRGHEMEHVVNERARAKNEGRRVISQTVTMQNGICPECGRVYTAGGVTRTTTAAETKEEIAKEPRWILAAAS